MTQTSEMYAYTASQDNYNSPTSPGHNPVQHSTSSQMNYPSVDNLLSDKKDTTKGSENWQSGPPPPYPSGGFTSSAQSTKPDLIGFGNPFAENSTSSKSSSSSEGDGITESFSKLSTNVNTASPSQPRPVISKPVFPAPPSSNTNQVAPPSPISPNAQASLLEQNTQILQLMNQMQGYFTKIMNYMDNVDKRISNLEGMTKNLVNAKPSDSGPMLDPKELEAAKRMQEQLEADIEYAKKLQSQFNDEIVAKKQQSDKKPSDSKVSAKPKTGSEPSTKAVCPVCNKMVPDVETHIDTCLEESKKLESQKKNQPPGTIYELGKQPPNNVLPGSGPQPPQQPMYGYPPYYVDPATGQLQYAYVYPPTVQPPQYQPNPPK